MLLDDLVGVIETLRGRITTHGATLRENETRTCMALIDPLLQALGWDTTDPSLVTPEYRVDVGWADYALRSVGNKPAAVIEAKRLESIVENHLDQAVGYCIQQGIAYAGVTDGSHWQLYRTFEPVPLVEKLVLDVSIASAPAHEAALKLLLLWRPNVVSGQSVEANSPVLGTQAQVVATKVTTQPTTLSTQSVLVVEEFTGPALISDAANWKPLSTVTYNLGDNKPIGIRFGGSSSKQIKNLVDTWFEVCEWLCSIGKLSDKDCPVPSPGSKGVRVLVNTTAQHPPSIKNPSGRNFAQAKQTSTGIFVETNYSPQSSIANAKFLLDKIGIPAEAVEIGFQ